jgi:hypothetical protein
MYLISACLPSLRPLFNVMLKDFQFDPLLDKIPGFGRSSRKSTGKNQLASRAVTIALADPTGKSPRNGKAGLGFSRIDEEWLGTQTGLATCFRESICDEDGLGDIERTRLDGGQFKSGIVVHKEFTVETTDVELYDKTAELEASNGTSSSNDSSKE